ncbi:D-2-hydroxyacid dehydrogenase (NADP+) [Agrobacterium larrymoorei]|uniref:D-2-hydroxyacid dehydrogenase (NADP+) n=1 Tax=Agrobacterium larrymoorei TaxID=160699 RepID=A0AAJ2EQC3_9HYPH|nr:D-2-hydroxyacid dehydrogenase [Agrobacterium larrymoorei]MDR6100464.1 D-2-hydroxyacid dehydrogenase (NADP+) [Agrobacterium larrymoorei]
MIGTNQLLPAYDELRLCFAHAAYDIKSIFDTEYSDVPSSFQVSTYDELKARLPEVDVLVVSGLWKNELLQYAPKLKYLQSVSSGTNQYDLAAFRERGILLASGQGVNMNAVSDQAIGLMLSLTRRLALARDNQAKRFWRPEQRNPDERETDVAGKTLLLVGLGRIGDRIARIARAMDMHVIGVRRDVAAGAGAANEVHSFRDMKSLIPRADLIMLSCPLTDETRNLMDREAIGAMRSTAYFINVARGGCVDEIALAEALQAGRIAGAAVDVTEVEPLPESSPLWSLPNVIVTPHSAGESRNYERNVLSILTRNLSMLLDNNASLINRVA